MEFVWRLTCAAELTRKRALGWLKPGQYTQVPKPRYQLPLTAQCWNISTNRLRYVDAGCGIKRTKIGSVSILERRELKRQKRNSIKLISFSDCLCGHSAGFLGWNPPPFATITPSVGKMTGKHLLKFSSLKNLRVLSVLSATIKSMMPGT